MHDFDETRLGPKHGTAQVTYIQDIIFTGINLAWGDASIEAAAADAGIQNVRHADYEVLRVLGAFVRFTTHVYGD